MNGIFLDRSDAGRELARQLGHWRGQPNVVVLALPRGGVPVGFEVARALEVALDVMVVRKLGFPGNPELAIGAIASGGARILNQRLIGYVANAERYIETQAVAEGLELERREQTFRRGRPAPDLRGKVTILVDDGLATGSTMSVAVTATRQLGAAKVIVAVPVGPPDSVDHLREVADEVICLHTPEDFHAVGQFYDDFTQTTDEEVTSLLSSAANFHSADSG